MEKIWKKAVSSRFSDQVVDLEICNDGTVKKITTGHVYKPHKKDGYYCIKRNGKAIFIHHLVAETFIEPRPKGMVVDHIDGDKNNNILSNLRYVDNTENGIKGNSSLNEIPQNIKNVDKIKILEEKINKMEEQITKLTKLTKLLEHLNIKDLEDN